MAWQEFGVSSQVANFLKVGHSFPVHITKLTTYNTKITRESLQQNITLTI